MRRDGVELDGEPAHVAYGHSVVRLAVTKTSVNGHSGWYFDLGVHGTWLSDKDADALARTLLFEGDQT